MELERGSHAVGLSQYHVVLVPYRRFKVFIRDDIRECADRTFRAIAKEHRFKIHELKIEKDHVHLFVSLRPSMSISYAIQLLKGATSRRLRQVFPALKGFHRCHLWSRGKCFRPISDVTPERIKYYIRTSQGKHHPKVEKKTWRPIEKKPRGLLQAKLGDYLTN